MRTPITFEIKSVHVLLLLTDYTYKLMSKLKLHVTVSHIEIDCSITVSKNSLGPSVWINHDLNSETGDFIRIPYSAFNKLVNSIPDFCRLVIGEKVCETLKPNAAFKLTVEIDSTLKFVTLVHAYLAKVDASKDGEGLGWVKEYYNGLEFEKRLYVRAPKSEDIGYCALSMLKYANDNTFIIKRTLWLSDNKAECNSINQGHEGYFSYEELKNEIKSMEDLHKFMTKEFTKMR